MGAILAGYRRDIEAGMGIETEQLVCSVCGARYPGTEPVWLCACGGLLDLDFQPVFDRKKIESRPPGLWRYREMLPQVADEHLLTLGEGSTPLVRIPLGGRPLLVKQDQLFPTGSYKDRGAVLMISKALALGVRKVVEDSSGNGGCAVAAYCARAGIACDIYVPADNSPGKLAQIAMYGARLVKVPGTREDTAAAAWEAAQHTYYASHSWNPYFFQGTKTWAYEVCEQLGWRAPDTVVVPAGNGTLLLGAYLGFVDLIRAGVIGRLPKIVAVQSEACAPMAVAFHQGLDAPAVITKQPTLAEGIAIAQPTRGKQIMAAVRESGGTFVTVAEAEIKSALLEVLRMGFYIEPTTAAVIAGAKCYAASAPADEEIVTVFTGHGLKATEKMVKFLE